MYIYHIRSIHSLQDTNELAMNEPKVSGEVIMFLSSFLPTLHALSTHLYTQINLACFRICFSSHDRRKEGVV